MELVAFGKEVLQNIAERAASYRFGQSALRQLDRALWVVEKCARWAVPPPLDQDERPPPELVRPLPWVFFLMMLITLRVSREFISLINLVMGKPPLRSADVVMFIQSKRRYLRTLKYQGSRMMRARTTQSHEPWYNSLYSMFELTMCFRRQSHNYGNNNTTRVSNNDEVMVVQRNNNSRPDATEPSTSECTMERLIEKMMVDLDAESDEDSTYTLTNITSPKSDRSECTESDQETLQNQTPQHNGTNLSDEIHFSPNKDISSTPEKHESDNTENGEHVNSKEILEENTVNLNNDSEVNQENDLEEIKVKDNPNNQNDDAECKRELSPKLESQAFIQNEAKTTPKKEHKMANGRTKSAPSKKKGGQRERQFSNEVLSTKVLPSNNSF